MEPADFRTALEAIQGIEHADTPAKVYSHLDLSLSAFGYDHTLFALSPSPQRMTFDKLVIYRQWPQDWFELYRVANFHAHDPVANHVRRQLDAFEWGDVPPTDDPVARRLMDISATDFGMRCGRCIPVHDSFGYRGAISLAGPEDCSIAKPAVDLIALFAFNRLNRLESHMRPQRLTAREKEVVSWAAAGKTAWDTSSILNVSEKTVEKHMASAMRKFDACSKAQVVAECLRAGEIML